MSRDERGAALLEVLTIGFAVVLLVVQAVMTMGRIQVTGEHATEVAQRAAVAAARDGDMAAATSAARAAAPGFVVVLERSGREYRATVSTTVSLVGPRSGPLRSTVTGRATATASPYRSGP